MFFYYIGHGRRDGIQGLWPVLCIDPLNTPSQRLAGSAIVQYLKRKSQKLTVIIFECCNGKPRSTSHITQILGEKDAGISDKLHLPGLRTLFLHTKGFIVVTSSKPGEPSFYTNDRLRPGSTFSRGFTWALIRKCTKETISWNEIFSKTRQYCVKNTKDEDGGPQHPIFSIE